MKLSIAIPCYEMKGMGVEVLEFSFKKMLSQLYKDFDVVITDHSENEDIENLCKKWGQFLDLKYFRNEYKRGLPAANTNLSIEKSTGEFIKLLCQDDYLYDEYSLLNIIHAFDDSTNWVASAYMHTQDKTNYFKYHLPKFSSNIYVNNTIGTPSCVTLRNVKNMPKFDDDLIIAYDCDFYKKFSNLYGPPKIIDAVTMINFLWPNQISSRPEAQSIIDKEFAYLRNKYE